MPLGIYLKNEAELSDMCQIMDKLSQCVPVQKEEAQIQVDDERYTHDRSKVIQIVFFGDQLTVARARGSIALRALHDTTIDQLKGLVPTVADWHSRQCLLQVNLNSSVSFTHH